MRRKIFAMSCLLAALAVPAFADEAALGKGQWVLAGDGGQGARTLKFEGGRVSGNGGCNSFGGDYTLSGDKLNFSPLFATRMACSGGRMEKEQAFFDLLGQVRGVKLAGSTLELLDAGGKVLARFDNQAPQ